MRRRHLFSFGLSICAVAMMTATLPRATAEETPPAPFVSQLVDDVQLRGIEDVHREGNYLYLPCREGKRLTICTLDDPAHPKIVSSFTHPELGPAAGFALHGNTAYLASQSNSRLLVVDVTDKSAPRLLGSTALGDGVLYKVAYHNGYCYVAQLTEKKLYVVDVRNPQAPAVVGSAVVTGGKDGPFSVLLHGDYALVGTIFGAENRLTVLNIQEPTAPRVVNEFIVPHAGQFSGEVVDDRYFAVHWDSNAFFVLDIGALPELRLVATLRDKRFGKPNRCIVAGNRAYLPMVEDDGIAVVDISDPTMPRFITTVRHPIMKKTYGAAINGDLLYVGARNGNSLVVLKQSALHGTPGIADDSDPLNHAE